MPMPARPSALVLAILALLTSSTVDAHVGLERKETSPGSYFKAVLTVPHGCQGAATTRLSVDVPEGLIGIKPMPKPGWRLATTSGPYARSYTYHGKSVSEGVRRITWEGGPLSDQHYDEFVFAGFVASELAAPATMHLPVHQTCETGAHAWVEIPAQGQTPRDLKEPAPSLRLIPSADTSHRH